ncbi:hypothetical protein LAZ67_1001529 [Cordylochernes scorpioides]|uniref:Reverse transcriptase RNase H-like domain-containing protein n=1 Tax=Cordylochernes scorpioides TaxID=51811 RepID=A0ABY6JVH9_9ARAC|nr:hypothetical protein LAZ67_1001529 [Cordylochernes scorpioides]
MPDHLKKYIIAARVQEPSEWYKITTQLKLSTNKEEEPQQPSTSTSTPVKKINSSKAHQYQPFPRTAAATHHQQEPYKSINQPPYPCKICASHQLPNQIHFHRDCPLKNNNHPKRTNPDASSLGVAGVLKQPDEQGILHPIGYFSRKLHPYEQNYTASEIETLAIINSVQRFHTYLHNIHFTLHTDHLPLKWIKNVKNPQETNAKVERLNSTIINRLRCEYNANLKIPWTKYIPKITESYNETVHTTTGFTPKFLYYGIQPQYIEHDTVTHTPIEKARKLAIERTIKSHEHSKQLYDIKHPEPIFKEGDQGDEKSLPNGFRITLCLNSKPGENRDSTSTINNREYRLLGTCIDCLWWNRASSIQSPDRSPSYLYVSRQLKKAFKNRVVPPDAEVKAEAEEWLRSQPKKFYEQRTYPTMSEMYGS